MNNFWNEIYLGNSIKDWIIALGIIVAAFVAIRIFKSIVLQQVRKWSQRTVTTFDDFVVETVEKSVVPILYIASIYMALDYLTIAAKVDKIIYIAFLFVATFFVLRIITSALKHIIFSFLGKQEDSETKKKQARGLLIIINVVIWAVGLVFLVDNLGYDVTTIIAGLGIGGIAIALAAQTILGDLFSYFVIFFDRPFEIGDFVVVNDKSGTVEYIGVKTTRIRALGGEQIICSNTDLTNARLHNYKRMERRRVVFSLGVIYESTSDMLEQIPVMVKDIIESVPDLTFDRGHFSGYGDFSLNFEFVYYVESSDYNIYMDKQQTVYLAIFKAFEQAGIQFAYPTQKLFLARENANENSTSKTSIA